MLTSNVQNVEMLYQPELKGKAFGVRVCLQPYFCLYLTAAQVGMGVLTTASYEARQYGVRSGMPSM